MGVDMTPVLIERLAELPNVRYVKESTGNLTRVGEILRRTGGRVGVFCGCDTLALESLREGAVGWVGGVVNVLPREHVRLFELACEQQDRAGAEQWSERMRPVLSMMEDEGKYTQLVKAGCALVGHPVGPPRRPLLPPRPEDLRRLGQKLSALGIPAAPASDGWSGGGIAADTVLRLSASGDGEKGNH